MFGHINEALPSRCKLLIKRICGAVLDPDLPGSTIELPKLTGINNQAIDLIESKQTLYGPIYSLGPVELETLKTYIKTWPMDLFIVQPDY